MMVPDGRMDSEKLEELLGNPEDTHLDLKAEVDLDSTEGKLKFTKDVVAMSNRPPGGYILIGVDDNETPPCMPAGTITNSKKRFDGARLGGLVRRYIEGGEVHLSVRVHELRGNQIVMIFVPHHRDCYLCPSARTDSSRSQARTGWAWYSEKVALGPRGRRERATPAFSLAGPPL